VAHFFNGLLAPLARSDLDEIWDYLGIQKDNPAAAARQTEMLFEKLFLLTTHPLLGEARPDLGDNLRSFVAGNYVVVYRVGGATLEIVRIIHAARDIRSLFGL
jgi:toxin ParE1/3/4